MAVVMKAKRQSVKTYIRNRRKYFILYIPTQLFIHGQWWSILRIHRLQTLSVNNHLSIVPAMVWFRWFVSIANSTSHEKLTIFDILCNQWMSIRWNRSGICKDTYIRKEENSIHRIWHMEHRLQRNRRKQRKRKRPRVCWQMIGRVKNYR